VEKTRISHIDEGAVRVPGLGIPADNSRGGLPGKTKKRKFTTLARRNRFAKGHQAGEGPLTNSKNPNDSPAFTRTTLKSSPAWNGQTYVQT